MVRGDGGNNRWKRSQCLLDDGRAGRIGEFHGDERTRTFAELLIDAEEDKDFGAVLVGMLRESENTSVRRRSIGVFSFSEGP